MCGIAGIVDLDGVPIRPADLLAMNRAIAHRGPDDEGYVLIDPVQSRCGNYAGAASASEVKAVLPLLDEEGGPGGATIGLAQRRFSIIDLSAAGHQPFFDGDRTCCVVFNGEIYNYLEIRKELAARGVRFFTQSDTEVLLEAYKAWGTDCFARLNGFWAIALYDFRKRHLLLSRDRIGKKPLYWTRVGSRLYFASEIKALLRVPEVHVRRRVNEEAAFHWLACGMKDLHWTTCFEGIYSLPAASWAIADSTFPRRRETFWRVPGQRQTERDISPADAAAGVRDILQDAVRIRLRADVPVSVELSGGMDSSTLAALAATVSGQRITTYTVSFPEREWNEEPFARTIGERYNTDYRVLQSPSEGFWRQIGAFTYLEEEPYHSPNLQTNQVIWAQMRAAGTKVSLNGAAGDEDFAGYEQYFIPAQLENLTHLRFGQYFRNGLRYSQGRTGIRSLYRPLAAWLSASFGTRSAESPAPAYFRGKQYPIVPTPPLLSDLLYSNMTDTLMPYWLRSGDRGSMGIPFEVRNPFLDYRMIEFAFRLPTTYLVRDGWHKWILRKAVEDLLPPDVVWRRRKMGFPFPYERFFSRSAGVVDLILEHADVPYLDFSMRDQFRRHWKTLSFILWYELFFNDNATLFAQIEALACKTQQAEEYGFVPEYLVSEAELKWS